ncbi:DUF4278 domain-containing protein [Oscillatoria sp. CS-180]|uniref:DUF4278 domain-containing protein n=1 Tax=Oscillatoria sp. CS-180 TaxID=3021720 RepID=UPI0023313969|nr:DUF4278 domain-containing protein [Oscillatoria sp. CS-180]MDB9526878.1 DUF4278 domain-containing protein [Oscillatoria sp. CS-180]
MARRLVLMELATAIELKTDETLPIRSGNLMKLTYRGVSYDAFIAGRTATETTEIGTFRGKNYAIKQSPLRFQKPAEEFVYRGIRYSR